MWPILFHIFSFFVLQTALDNLKTSRLLIESHTILSFKQTGMTRILLNTLPPRDATPELTVTVAMNYGATEMMLLRDSI